MAERTVVNSLAGTVMAVSAGLPATYDAAGYGATSITYTTVGEVESIGEHGVTAAVTEFTPIDTSTVTKVKGSKNYGTLPLTMGALPSDGGQDILELAAESNNHYSIKLTYQDTSIHYLDVLVSKFAQVNGAVDDIAKIACELAVCRIPVIVPQA